MEWIEPTTRASTDLSRSTAPRSWSCVVVGGRAVSCDQQCSVRLGRQDRRVGDRQQWWRVDDDHVVGLAQLIENVVHGVRLQQLGRVRRRGATGDDGRARTPRLHRLRNRDEAQAPFWLRSELVSPCPTTLDWRRARSLVGVLAPSTCTAPSCASSPVRGGGRSPSASCHWPSRSTPAAAAAPG